MLVVYAVEWVESEFGKRPEGYKIFTDKGHCIEQTRKDREKGPYSDGSGYCGPEIPVGYYEVPWECLEEKVKETLMEQTGERRVTFSSNNWEPKFKTRMEAITTTRTT